MANDAFIKLGDDGQNAPALRYSIREPVAYFTRNIIPVNVPKEYFDMAKMGTDERDKEIAATPSIGQTMNERRAYEEFLEASRATGLTGGGKTIEGGTGPQEIGGAAGYTPEMLYDTLLSGREITRPPGAARIYFAQSGAQNAKDAFIKSGSQLVFTEGLYGFNGIKVAPPKTTTVEPRLLIIESYQLSNYRGDYGAGPVIKTHSLAPGEKNRFSVKTYEKTTEKENEGSSILDSNTSEASLDLEMSFQREQSNKLDTLVADIKNSEQVDGSAGFLGVSVSAGYQETGEWGTRRARENFTKTAENAVTKHSQRASSKRNVEVNLSRESTTESGVESSVAREVENINVSRTLNLVFRQMVQEYFSILHLVDVKLAIYDGTHGPYVEYSISEIDQMLDDYFVQDQAKRTEVKIGILRELYFTLDYQEQPVQFLEKVSYPAGAEMPPELAFKETLEYWRVKRGLQTQIPELPGVQIPGVVTSVNKITMRTDGVLLDTFLGLGEGLDDYAKGLQMEAVNEKRLENQKKETGILIVEGLPDAQKADAFDKIFGEKVVYRNSEQPT